ncbi:MAG: polysaccharide biosynthesis C-terminal domain-containing protein, partial [Candidatus Zixiibacteriota bacterium]
FHRFDINNYFVIGNNIIQTLGIIVLLENGLGLIEMAALILFLNIVGIVWRTRIRINLFPEVRFSRSLIDKTTARQMINYGIYSFLIVIAWTVIYQTDNIVIGAFISTESITLYSVPAMIVIQLRSSISTIAIPLVSTISHYEALEDYAKIMSIYSKSMRYLYYVSAFLCIMLFFFGGPFILLWVKKDFLGSIIILKILIFGAAFAFPHNITNAILSGISKHRIAFFILGAEALANIILSVILVQSRGIAGVALGTAIPQLIIYIFIYPVVFYKTMGAKIKDFYTLAAASSVKAILLILPSSYIICKLIDPGTWPTLVLDCAVVTIIMAAGFWALILEKEDRAQVKAKIRAKLGRT